MSFPRYEAYKDSGVEWLGEVPSHWNIVRIGSLFVEATQPGIVDLPILSVSIHDGVSDDELSPDDMDRKVSRSDDKTKYKRVQPGDLVYNMMRAWQGGFGTVRFAGMVSPAYVVARPKRTDFATAIVESILRTPLAIEEMRRRSHGVTDFRLRLYWEEFKSIRIALPPLGEQEDIRSFLDRETAKIDALVEEQQRLIALLEEKRQAVISHAVTKGLDPDAPMKDSGVEWLGEVPAHWEVKAVWMLFNLGRGRVLSHQDIADDPGPYPVYSSQTENEGVMGTISSYDFEGDYLTWTTDGANAGTVFKRSGRFNCTNVCGTLKPKHQVDLDFLKCALSEATGYFVRHDINPKLMNNTMGSIRLPVPPFEEQENITGYVRMRTGHYAEIIRKAEAAITLLQERRAALISAAVTGKIDVRGLAFLEEATA